MSKVIWNGIATLPQEIKVTPESDAPVILQLSGTVYTYNQNKEIGLTVSVGGDPLISATLYANQNGVHVATGVALQSVRLPVKYVDGVIQPITYTIDKMNADTLFDAQDTVSLLQID